ncbi:hypothetical protein FAIPA1_70141 [Frankia sp. AiPs1]
MIPGHIVSERAARPIVTIRPARGQAGLRSRPLGPRGSPPHTRSAARPVATGHLDATHPYLPHPYCDITCDDTAHATSVTGNSPQHLDRELSKLRFCCSAGVSFADEVVEHLIQVAPRGCSRTRLGDWLSIENGDSHRDVP